MKLFIVVDSNNQWLWYGRASDFVEALECAKDASEYDSEATTIYCFEVVNEERIELDDSERR